ncbi:tripartite tricarboxylate transporter substrate binding protein [Pollutimonas bauzanensis]|uniref:Bug family tripartite tricarboxylate transporter substrate binding protein n=1 Tax=Pollutimonas bauzanensis TaxID=658167 RepID=UPI00333F6756
MKNYRKLLASALMCALPVLVHAAEYPDRSISWVVPYAAGGGTDVVARTLANEMSKSLGQSIVIENKPGANTAIGASQVARAQNDGYTVGSADNATLALNQHLFPKLTYLPESDFAFVGGLARFPYVLVVNPGLPVNSISDLLTLAKEKPGAISYGSPGMGGPNHVAMELLQQRTGTEFLHVAYRGAAPVMQDLIAGQIQFALIDTASSIQYIQSKRVRPIAVSTEKRLTSLPDVPTFTEAGVADFIAFSWQGMIVPKNTPAPVIEKLNSALNTALSSEKVHEALTAMGVERAPTTAAEFRQFVADQDKLWGNVIREAKISLDK